MLLLLYTLKKCAQFEIYIYFSQYFPIKEEEEVDQLRRRLEETEQAMERICRQMGSVADRLSPVCVAQLLTSQLDKVWNNPFIKFFKIRIVRIRLYDRPQK